MVFFTARKTSPRQRSIYLKFFMLDCALCDKQNAPWIPLIMELDGAGAKFSHFAGYT